MQRLQKWKLTGVPQGATVTGRPGAATHLERSVRHEVVARSICPVLNGVLVAQI